MIVPEICVPFIEANYTATMAECEIQMKEATCAMPSATSAAVPTSMPATSGALPTSVPATGAFITTPSASPAVIPVTLPPSTPSQAVSNVTTAPNVTGSHMPYSSRFRSLKTMMKGLLGGR